MTISIEIWKSTLVNGQTKLATSLPCCLISVGCLIGLQCRNANGNEWNAKSTAFRNNIIKVFSVHPDLSNCRSIVSLSNKCNRFSMSWHIIWICVSHVIKSQFSHPIFNLSLFAFRMSCLPITPNINFDRKNHLKIKRFLTWNQRFQYSYFQKFNDFLIWTDSFVWMPLITDIFFAVINFFLFLFIRNHCQFLTPFELIRDFGM